MKKIGLYILSFYLSIVLVSMSVVSCSKDMRQDFQMPTIDNIDTSEDVVYEESETIDDSWIEEKYNTEAQGKIIEFKTSLVCADTSGFGGCETFKYKDYTPISKDPNLSNHITVKLNAYFKINKIVYNDTEVVYDSLIRLDSFRFRLSIHAKSDLLKTNKCHFQLVDSTNPAQTAIGKKFKAVGRIGKFGIYGSSYWITRRHRVVSGTYSNTVAARVEIDNSYVPKKGDMLVWDYEDAKEYYIAPVTTEPTPTKVAAKAATATKTAIPAHTVYAFNLEEMNAKRGKSGACTSGITTKKVKMKSYDIEETLKSSSVDRGTPKWYHRDE